MCGIAGIMTIEGSPSKVQLDIMKKALRHRGPDDEGLVVQENLGLVHTRLSIIDLAQGHQPLEDDQGNLLIINGEIYNYLELRREYSNFSFKTQSDSESVFPLYQKYGEGFIPYLRGMFGLAFYDFSKKELILARDLFGIKPLYYLTWEGGMAFASELQALVKSNFFPFKKHVNSLKEILELRYTTSRETPFEGIYRVLPGETLIFKEGKLLKKQRYSFPSQTKPLSFSENELLQEFEKIMSHSVEVHLRSDVPYGLFLSGGLDSAVILALTSRYTDQPIKTFTIGFSGTYLHDEREQAQRLSSHFKTEHHSLDLKEEDFWTLLPEIIEKIDDPFIDPAIIPTFILAREARKSVKVILSGEGGDELFGGYRRYQKVGWPRWLGGRIVRQKGIFEKQGLKSPFLKNWNQGLMRLKENFSEVESTKMQLAQRIDLETWLANALLIKFDRCLMAHGIEGRTPFLDPKVAEFAFSLPDSFKVRRGYGKWILRQWLERYVPSAQPFAKKRGFSVPVSEWISKKSSQLGPLLARQEGIQEIFDPHDVRSFFSNPERNQDFIGWSLLFYGLWHQLHVLKKPPTSDAFSTLMS